MKPPCFSKTQDSYKWSSFILFLAALYNVIWGAIAVLYPTLMLDLLGVPLHGNIEFWQCIGMLVGAYGIGYWFASKDPLRYWPILLVGLIGKIGGPIGAVIAITNDSLPITFFWLNVLNDLIWILPFSFILLHVRRCFRNISSKDGKEALPPLYRRVLKEDFDTLSPQVREFHDAVEPIEVRGRFSFERGNNIVANALADRVGFPREHDDMEVSLRVQQDGNREYWYRMFGKRRVVSEQWESQGLLVEKYGNLVLYLHAKVSSGALQVTEMRCTFFGIPLPPFLTPRVTASGIDSPKGIEVSVDVFLSPFGRMVKYSGFVTIRPSS